MWKRIREIVRKEMLQVLRDPRLRFTLIMPPIIQTIVFGFAVNLDVENSKIAWMDKDRTWRSRELEYALRSSHSFTIVAMPDSDREVQELLDKGEVLAVVRVLPGFAESISRGQTANVQVLVDGTNSNTASIVGNYISLAIAAFSADLQADRQNQLLLSRGAPKPVAARAPQLAPETRVWFNPELKSRNYFIPGVIVNIIMLITVTLTALAIVREKETGTMEQLLVTPMRPMELMIGKMIPFGIVGLINVVLVTVVALIVFRIPFRGSFPVLLLGAMFYVMSTLGIGLFISTISGTQQQAMLSSFFFTVPAFMLSGFAFPIRNMPPLFQYVTYLNPLRYFMEIVRDVFLKGSGIDLLWPKMVALAVFGVLIMSFSASRFRKRLD